MAKEIDINTDEGRKKFLKGKKIVFACCFCDRVIPFEWMAEKNPDLATIIIDKTGQNYWCHVKCLKKKMTKETRSEM